MDPDVVNDPRYRDTLRDDLKWSDGEPLTAEDVAYTINRARDEEWLNHYSTVENLTEPPSPSAVLRIDAPVPGIISPLAFSPTGSPAMIALGIYLYGGGAADFVAREQPKWQKWMVGSFPTN